MIERSYYSVKYLAEHMDVSTRKMEVIDLARRKTIVANVPGTANRLARQVN